MTPSARGSGPRLSTPRSEDVPLFGYYLAFLKADQAGMDRQAAVARSRPGGEESISHIEALVLARAGRLEAAATLARRAVDVVARAGRREGVARVRSGTRSVERVLRGGDRGPAARRRSATAIARPRRSNTRPPWRWRWPAT